MPSRGREGSPPARAAKPLHEQTFSETVPPGDTRLRRVCDHCGFVDYVNPRVVVGAVCSWDEKILLCRRAIEPRRGYWTMPAGFLEAGEACAQGAARETREEACAEIEIDGLLAVYNVPRLSQVHLIYRAGLIDGRFAAGEETLEARLFDWTDIPWSDLAFPSVRFALERYAEVGERSEFAPAEHSADPTDRPAT